MKLAQISCKGVLTAALLGISLVSAQAIAGECTAVFTGGIGGNSNSGEIEFGEYAVIYNNPSTSLVASSIDNNDKGNSCVTQDCTATGSTTATMNFDPFQSTNSNTSYTIRENRSGTIGTSTNEYKEVKLEKNSTMSVSGNYTYYEMDKLTIGENGIATMPAGDYWIEEFKMEKNSRLVISGSGTARFYFKKDATIGENAQFNTYNDGSYHPEKLMIYSKKELKLEKNSHLVGFIYTDDKMTFGEGSITRGSISVKSGKLEKNAQVYYMGDELTELETGGYCTSTPLHHYEIVHDASGSTCDAESITIKACANADCSSLYTSSISIDLLGDGTTLASETFSGSVSTSINHTTVETLTLSLANETIAAQNADECDDGSGGSSCDIVFSNNTCPVAGSCAAIFPDGLNNSDASGYIRFQNTGRLTGNNDIYLTTTDVDLNGSATTCETADCIASNTIAATMASNFVSYSNNSDFEADNTTRTITGNDFKDVESKNNGTLNMSASYTSYSFRRLKARSGSTLNLTPGDYYVAQLDFNDATVNVVGNGTVRIWVTNSSKFRNDAIINGGSSGDPSKLFVYFFAQRNSDKMTIESGAYAAAYVYSDNKVEVKGDSKFYGAITAVGELKIRNTAEVIADTSTLNNADFGVGCASSNTGVNHYRFEYDGNGLTCAVENVVIKACANDDCSTLYNSQSDIGFAVTADSNTVTSNLSFTGSTAVDVAESSPQTVSMGLTSSSPEATLQCYQNGSLDGDCDYVLEDTGFIFLDTDNSSQTMPMQISGKSSNEGYESVNLALQAVQTDTTTGACVPLFADAAGVDVQLSMQCENPGSCVTLPSNANDLVFSNNGNDYFVSQYPSYGAHRLYFDNESKAAFSINYPDAGQIKLHAQMSIVLSGSETKVMTGNSNPIVVRPFGFYVAASGNQNASNNQGIAYRQAGENFSLTVAAKQWESADDCDNDGQIDINVNCGGSVVTADLSNNNITPNFGQETSTETVSVSTTIVSPVGGDSPALSSNSFGSFTLGSQTNTVTWDNVGIFSAFAGLTGDTVYLGSESIAGYIANVGRFVPSYFELDASAVASGCGDFSYMGQDIPITYDVSAKGVGGTVLTNYDSSAADPLTDTDYHGLGGFTLVAENDNNGVNLNARLGDISFTWVDGIANGANDLQFARAVNGDGHPQADGPYSSVELGLLAEDNDATATVDFNVKDINAGSAANCVTAVNCDAKKLGVGAFDIRFGRLAGAEVFGVESEELTLPLVTQYYNGSRFVTSTTDGCTELEPADITISGVSNNPFSAIYDYAVYNISDDSVVGNTRLQIDGNTTTTKATAENGEFDLTFNATNVQGYIPISIDITSYPWLQYDWSTNGQGEVETTIPTYNINFGQYRGNDRVIYWREKK